VNQRKHLTLVASAASLLAALPLATVFEQWTWLIHAFLIVAVMCGVAVLIRSLRAPSWAPTASLFAAGLLVLTWLYPSGHEIAGIIPSLDTFKHFNNLLTTAATEMSEFSAPVEDREGFLFLTTLGIGGVAIVIDLFAVVLRRPALAGLPMLAIYSVPVAVAEDSVSMFPFLLGAAGFLWLLVTDNVDRVRRFGRRFTGDGRDVDLWEPSPLAAAGQRLGLIGLALAVLLPMAWPGMTTGLLERFGNGTGAGFTGGAGNGRSVNLTAALSGELNRDHPDPMIRVTNVDDDKPFYLRFAVSDQLRSDGFVNRSLAGGARINNGISQPDFTDSGVTTSTHHATVEVLDLNQAFLPVYTAPSKIEGLDSTWQYDASTSTIYSNRETTKKKKYSFTYVKPDFTESDLRGAAPLDPSSSIVANFSKLPGSPITKVKNIVDKAIEGRTTEYDKVISLLTVFSTTNGFSYSLTTDYGTSGSKIVDFLEKKKGFCLQYASALGWLLRQAKIPSRVAFGFTQGGAKQGRTVTLNSNNLHAWTEAYFPGFGWVPFDATPASGISGSVSTQWSPNPSPVQTSDPNNDTDVLHPGQAPSTDASSGAVNPQAGGADPTGGSAADKLDVKFLVTMIAVGVGILLVVLLLLSPALSRSRRRRRRLRFNRASEAAFARVKADGSPDTAGGPTPAPGVPTVLPADDTVFQTARANAHQAWDELLDTMTDYHVEIDDAETPRRTGVRLLERERLRDQAADGVQTLSTAEERARYAVRPITGQELRTSLGAVRSALSARASRRVRIMAVLLPPSVVQRWRFSAWQRFTDTANAVGGRRDAVVRTLSVRRMVTRRSKPKSKR
jgi:transglutaminase-like putative cysteine protease